MTPEMERWPVYYQPRVNNDEALSRFEEKYRPFLRAVTEGRPRRFGEFGCGIASVTKLVRTRLWPELHVLVDISVSMLGMARENLGSPGYNELKFVNHDIRRPYPGRESFDVIHSQGVLEHFADQEVRAIISHQLPLARRLVHCVPSSRYQGAAYGDERLMTPLEWLGICNPLEVLEFNDGFELALIWEGTA